MIAFIKNIISRKKYPQIFALRKQKNYLDATSWHDDDLSNVPIDTICLTLENAIITDKGIMSLPQLTMLKCIDLDSTKITDKSIDKLISFKRLEELWIEDTKITDDGFKKLTSLKNLRFISFLDTDISDDAYNYIKQHLPDTKLHG
ncbi:MAG: hypothetical protein HWE16_09760 [Gammaproteobacteria bacterium]|nr:hypothetical protein [Gammaproteobacteria bacterium]